MAERIISRLQTPVDENGVRKDIHTITTSDAVIIDGENCTLTEKLQNLGNGIVISTNKPTHAAMWAQVLRVE